MKKIISLLIFLSSFNVLAETKIKVAVIDTGLSLNYSKMANLCPSDHKDFTGEGLNDRHGHGTNVAGLIVQNAKDSNYCLVIIKAYAFGGKPKHYITEALKYAYDINANVINLSGGGLDPIPAERDIVQKILDSRKTLVVAAGNERLDLDRNCRYYPACYDSRIYVIGSYSSYSNYGKYVDMFIDGNNKTAFGYNFSGTSQSTAIFTGSLLKNIGVLQKEMNK